MKTTTPPGTTPTLVGLTLPELLEWHRRAQDLVDACDSRDDRLPRRVANRDAILAEIRRRSA